MDKQKIIIENGNVERKFVAAQGGIREILQIIAMEKRNNLKEIRNSVAREALTKILTYKGSSALVIKGVRRCGKSTLMEQFIRKRLGDDFLYFNFDDERLSDFTVKDFQTLMEVLIELFGDRKNIFLDEIQNIAGWELFVNRLLQSGYRVFITGSNADLLSKELGSHMTGRHSDIELYPFSFREFLVSKGFSAKPQKGYVTTERALLAGKFREYMVVGGLPEVDVNSDSSAPRTILNDIIQKDILNRYEIRKSSDLRSILNFLIANSGNRITFASITKNFGLKSPITVQKYVEYAEEAYLLFTVKRFERRIRKLDKNPRKIYCIDNGIIVKNSPTINERLGALLENLVAIHLRATGHEVYYYMGKTGRETDFIVPKVGLAIQVCLDFTTNDTKKREVNGLIEAMHETKCPKGIIITMDQETEIKVKGNVIRVIPAWRWLLEDGAESTG